LDENNQTAFFGLQKAFENKESAGRNHHASIKKNE